MTKLIIHSTVINDRFEAVIVGGNRMCGQTGKGGKI